MGHIVALVQGWAKVSFPGLVNFVPAVVYQFFLNLLAVLSGKLGMLIWPTPVGLLWRDKSRWSEIAKGL